MMERAKTDFPEPDSPTIPRVLPRSSVNVTPRTAWTRPRSEVKFVFRSVTCSSGPSVGSSSGVCPGPVTSAGWVSVVVIGTTFLVRSDLHDSFADPRSQRTLPHVEVVTDYVAEVVERQHGEEDGDTGYEHD